MPRTSLPHPPGVHVRTGQGGRRRRPSRMPRLVGVAASVAVGCLTVGSLAVAASNGTSESAKPAAPRPAAALGAAAGVTVQAEKNLNRGLVSVHDGDDNLVSWRLLATDPADVAFNVYRGGTKVNSAPITGSTNFRHHNAPAHADYQVKAVVNGQEQGFSEHAVQLRGGYLDVPISRPPGGSGFSYAANDASVGDLDGDGDLDIVLKWDPSNAKDNSQSGVTGHTIVDGYTLQGDRLWRIDLGRNIRSGAHYTQFQVFDYDGDGRAEVAMKTADGTRDGRGTVIGNSGADHRNSEGRVLSGPEYLTMFSGSTGAALSTVDYVPARGDVCSWGDCYGNRVDRFLAGTAYLNGSTPSLVMARGYYTRTVIAAWDFRNGQLTRRWTFDTNSSTNVGKGYDGQGSHSLSIGDVDGDGRDEIVYGAMAVDDNGHGLWTTRTGHGDAQHLADLDPRDPGLEYFKVSESRSQPSSLYIDPANGSIFWRTGSGTDNGRGVAGDIWAGNAGAEMWSAADSSIRDTSGATRGRKPSSANFLVWWDGDTTRELLDGTRIDKYGTGGDTRLLTGSNVHSNNGTKSTPSLSGDILGDWREEVIWPRSDDNALRIYSTPIETDRRFVTLLQDRMYRTGLAWQNTAYNQPPHPSFFLGGGAG
ncbi:rhamnogalacturonan lyase [Streptomyces sp. NPDC006294]|uniref:rhamnogalacturonan lyase n=2 Tax=unclassified Streptomyces TaxID=2593676 RepID=UPI003693E431